GRGGGCPPPAVVHAGLEARGRTAGRPPMAAPRETASRNADCPCRSGLRPPGSRPSRAECRSPSAPSVLRASSDRWSTTIVRSGSDRRGRSSRSPRNLAYERTERLASRLEIRELIEGRASGRQQHDGALYTLGLGRCPCPFYCSREVARASVCNRISECPAEALCGITDQESPADAREERAQRLDAALFRHPARDPVDRVVAHESARRGVRVGRLRVVDISNAVDCRDQLLPMRETGEAFDA